MLLTSSQMHAIQHSAGWRHRRVCVCVGLRAVRGGAPHARYTLISYLGAWYPLLDSVPRTAELWFFSLAAGAFLGAKFFSF